MKLLHDFIFLLIFSLFSFPKLNISAAATDTLFRGQTLSGDQTLVSRYGNFELGFFSPGNSHRYYLAIWYKKVSVRTTAWVANRDKPLSNPSSSLLKLTTTGKLVLLQTAPNTTVIWSSESASSAAIAVLGDDGNLVVKDGNSSSQTTYWQSFDHPTNTYLPGAKLGYDKFAGINRFLTSWRSSDDPSPGLFSFEINPRGVSQFFLYSNRTHEYFTTGVWNGKIFSGVPEMRSNYFFNFNYVANANVNYFSFAVRDKSAITNFMLDYDGQMKRSQWDNNTKQWVLYGVLPRNPCDVYGICGPFSSCSSTTSPFCQCLRGFKPRLLEEWNSGGASSGCSRRTSLSCDENDDFDMLFGVQMPTNPHQLVAAVRSAKQCGQTCLKNCSCTAYSFNSGCVLWFGDLLNLKRFSATAKSNSATLYIRLAASELRRPKEEWKMYKIVVVVLTIAAFAVIACILLACAFRKRKAVGTGKQISGSLLLFDYRTIKRATSGFSQKLGSGSFGAVFKGVLQDGTVVAVKKLEGFRQGEKQFRMEVSTLGMIQHVNLVRLRGFCSESDKRLLIYDCMPNGSLDLYLFGRNDGSETLTWNQRFNIAIGIARGLAYLHEKCRECIIHCDIKPENILLDTNLCPKVADFGMAKLIGREFSRVLTSMRGTFGYLAPEWIAGSAITPKADVYSFGLLLLEIVSGKRNSNMNDDGECVYFPLLVATKLYESDVLCLLDEQLKGEANLEELERACRVACWCIQDHELWRPTMGHVVQMLEGVVDVAVPPIPKLLQTLATE
ncbi:G-type lectin S-receptor-like serine/threonine-protein kinase [Ananas comosus]|uniref:Receptor-like serine/threonine-protein kinase n=1 Tax=Ananas comosus TaxID=4615 RepID=A0A199UQ24_ANACO|nr:G-type lectin S-receptor-like serine/threonine-protein kinase [Ananas comosus]